MLFSLAYFPQAADNLQSCFGEEIGLNISKKYIIDLKWDLPAGMFSVALRNSYCDGCQFSSDAKRWDFVMLFLQIKLV